MDGAPPSQQVTFTFGHVHGSSYKKKKQVDEQGDYQKTLQHQIPTPICTIQSTQSWLANARGNFQLQRRKEQIALRTFVSIEHS